MARIESRELDKKVIIIMIKILICREFYIIVISIY